MVVDHPRGLHERVTHGWADEAETATLQLATHLRRLGRAGRHLARHRPAIDHWRPADERPQQVDETLAVPGQIEQRARIADGGVNLSAVAHDVGVVEQAFASGIIAGRGGEICTRGSCVTGGEIRPIGATQEGTKKAEPGRMLHSSAVVLTTGTFMRGLMHVGQIRTQGGRIGEGASVGISAWLAQAGFELGRLKTGTPPRLARETIDWEGLPRARGDTEPVPFSDLTSLTQFPTLPQVDCRQTSTNARIHAIIEANLHLAPMYSGAIEAAGPRYCPSIEDKVVRFPQRESHNVFLEPESLEDSVVYCNGISTSLPAAIQEQIVHAMPGCKRAKILRPGYAVEYDMVRPHQILATCMTKRIRGLYLAGQINGTSGYEEAAAQGLVAGVNAARLVLDRGEWVLGRDEAYIGVLMDDLVTKTPVEPYRMFTSRQSIGSCCGRITLRIG